MAIPSKSLPPAATSWHDPAIPAFSALCDEALRRCAAQHSLPVELCEEMRLRAWELCWVAVDAASAPANQLPATADSQGWPPELIEQLRATPGLIKLNTRTWQELRRVREQQLFATLPPQGSAAAEPVANEALAALMTEAFSQLELEALRAWITPSVAAAIARWLSAALLAVDALALSDDATDATALELVVFVHATLQREHGAAAPAVDLVQSEPVVSAALSDRRAPEAPREEPAAARAPQPAAASAHQAAAAAAHQPAAASAHQAPAASAHQAAAASAPQAPAAAAPLPAAVAESAAASAPQAPAAAAPLPAAVAESAAAAAPLTAAIAESTAAAPPSMDPKDATHVDAPMAATVPRRMKPLAIAQIAGAIAIAAVLLLMFRSGSPSEPDAAQPANQAKSSVTAPEQPAHIVTPKPLVVQPAPITPVATPAAPPPRSTKQPASAATQRPRFRNVAAAKRAHTAKKLDDAAYAAAIAELEALRKAQIAKEQVKLHNGKLNQADYQRKVDAINKNLGFDRP